MAEQVSKCHCSAYTPPVLRFYDQAGHNKPTYNKPTYNKTTYNKAAYNKLDNNKNAIIRKWNNKI